MGMIIYPCLSTDYKCYSIIAIYNVRSILAQKYKVIIKNEIVYSINNTRSTIVWIKPFF